MAIAHTNRLAPNGNGANVPAKQSVTNFIDQIRPEIAKALPPAVGKVLTADRLCRLALTACRLNPKLAECDFKSLAGSLMTAAQLGLEPNTPLGHCYLIPRRNGRTGLNEATFQLGYQGMVELSQRSGRIQTQYAFPVYANDEFDYWLGLDANIIHRPAVGNRGPLVAVYAVAKYKDGGSNFVVLTVDEVESYRKRSMAGNNGPWVTDYEAMACKTAFRRLFRWLPKSTELALAISADDSVPKWEAMSGEVIHDYPTIESTPPLAIQDVAEEAFEPEPVEAAPAQQPEPPKKKAPARRSVEAQAKPVEPPPLPDNETDTPFDMPSNDFNLASSQPKITIMQSQAKPSEKAGIAKNIEGWITQKCSEFDQRGFSDLAKRDSLVAILYERLSRENVIKSTNSTLTHRQVFELATVADSWEAAEQALNYAANQIATEMYSN